MIRVATILLAALCTAGATQLLGQQPILAPVVEGRIPQASAPGAPLPGPRLAPELRSYEPTFADNRATGQPLLMSSGSNNTFVISTLSLVLIAVIVVLLVA